MYEDSRINQVSFTPYRHPTEYLRCDIHHVGDMQPQKAHSRTRNTHLQNTPPPQIPTIQRPIPPRKPIQPLETIPAPTGDGSAKYAAHLDSQKEPCVVNDLGGQAPFPSS